MNTWLETYPTLIGVRLNMVVNGLGEFTDENGSSRGISNELDRKLIGHLRRISDVVVTGGNTARSEQYTVPSSCSLAVISRSFELDGERFMRLPDPKVALATLKNQGFNRILLETGPTLSKFFLETQAVDEFCLTVTGGDLKVATETVTGWASNLELASTIELEGTLFTRWRRGNSYPHH